MDSLTSAAASGLRARLESLDMLSNNIANASTAGFKKDSEFYSLYVDAEARGGPEQPLLGTMPVVEKPWTDFSQGTLQTTGNPLDVALQGEGFFAVNGPSGTLYTRNGSFHANATGQVVTGDGYPLRLVGGTALRVQPNTPFQIGPDGAVMQSGASLGRLEVVDLPKDGILKQGASFFKLLDPKAVPPASKAEIYQGRLEGANVGSAESAVRLVGLLRQFEALQKAITIGSEMNRKAIEEVARVGS
jgi:flagellar basal body rod protein FlgG